jgi:hypothetical protein
MKRIGRAAVVLATVTILFFYPFLAPPAHRIDQAHLDLIKSGMTEAEVEDVFGVPAGEYDWAVAVPPNVWADISYFRVGQTWGVEGQKQQQIVIFDIGEIKSWIGRHGAFHVIFDRQGRVCSTGWVGKTRIEPPWNRWWRQWTGKRRGGRT